MIRSRVSAASRGLFLLMCFQLPFALSGNLKEPEQKGLFVYLFILFCFMGFFLIYFMLFYFILLFPYCNHKSNPNPHPCHPLRDANDVSHGHGAHWGEQKEWGQAVARGCSQLRSGGTENTKFLQENFPHTHLSQS